MLRLCSTNCKHGCITYIFNTWETAMTSQGHVTSASLKQANNKNIEGHFLSACISKKNSAHPSLTQQIEGPLTVWCESLDMIRQMAQSYKQKLWRRRMLVLHSGTSSTQYWDELSKIKSQYMKLCTLTKIPIQWFFTMALYMFFLLVDQKYDNDSIHWFNDNSVYFFATRCVQYRKH